MNEPSHDDGQSAERGLPKIEFETVNADISDIKLIDIPALVVFWALMLVVFLQFFTRYVLNDSLGWTEEVARFLLIIVGYVGAVTAVRKGSHIFLEFFYRYLPLKAGKAVAVVVEFINVAFYGYLAWVAVLLADKTRQKMVSIDVPKSLIYWVVAVCLALMAINSLVWLYKKIRQPSSDVVAQLEERAINE
ncbi:TRAP transporter small permease [Denitrobaculum tricleocarpae]|uniref:TRAP transporter small permease protein n=1 Tax=Denitrobaculum tricleocarpae TaxID=2591009 RepID=A0A545TTU2_9PROT|nr:TRAP transporter small permease [Denitrobaculum tricleocarpae]TQV80571.1 TRAP transporter small permease [Denitrobaculum tricleocarpae]